MKDGKKQQGIALVALIAIHKERIGLYEELAHHVPKTQIDLRSALEDLMVQARMLKQALIEALTEFGDMSDIDNEPEKPYFYETWCMRIDTIHGMPAIEQITAIEESTQLIYEMAQASVLFDDTIAAILQSQQHELTYMMAKLQLVIRKKEA